MNVFIVCGGWDYEGYDILAVLDSEQKAKDWENKHTSQQEEEHQCHDYHKIQEKTLL